MNTDSTFYSEQNYFRKICLLLTIPCAIAPMLIAVMGWMQPMGDPLLFAYDRVAFGAIYVLYFAGMMYSFQVHRHYLPMLLFGGHIASLFVFWLMEVNEWLGYLVILSLVATSIVNQYFRVGSVACSTDTCSPRNV